MHNTHKKAFSLLETMLAVGVLTMMTSVAASIASGASRATAMAEDKMVAIYLAEEAGEVVKNIWQDALNSGKKNIQGTVLQDCEGAIHGCYIITAPKGIAVCESSNCGTLYLDENGYAWNGANGSKYERVIKIRQVNMGTNEEKTYKVSVGLKWGEEENKKISFDYYLFPIGIYVTPSP